MEPRESIRAFLEDYPLDRYTSPQPSDVGQCLGLAEARLLNQDPDRLRRALDTVVYGDLSEAALAETRRALGLRNLKTLAELLEGTEPAPGTLLPCPPGPLPEPIPLTGEGPSAAEMILADREAPSMGASARHPRREK